MIIMMLIYMFIIGKILIMVSAALLYYCLIHSTMWGAVIDSITRSIIICDTVEAFQVYNTKINVANSDRHDQETSSVGHF